MTTCNYYDDHKHTLPVLIDLTRAVSVFFSWVANVVNTTNGALNAGSAISLNTGKTVVQYLGIPFAKAERFEYPFPPEKWTSTGKEGE